MNKESIQKCVMNMVENSLSCKKNSERTTDGYSLSKEDTKLSISFSEGKNINISHNGKEVKNFEIGQAKDMKGAMNEAAGILKDIAKTLDTLALKPNQLEKDNKGIQKEKNNGLEL